MYKREDNTTEKLILICVCGKIKIRRWMFYYLIVVE